MRTMMVLLLMPLLFGCGSAAVLETIGTTTEKLKPIVAGWKKICVTSRTCLEAAGEDTAEIEEICEKGWALFQVIQAVQENTIRAAGGEPCTNCSNQ